MQNLPATDDIPLGHGEFFAETAPGRTKIEATATAAKIILLFYSTAESKLSDDELADIRKDKIGFVFQSFNLLPRTSVLENVELPMLYNNKVLASDRKGKALNAIKSVGLADRIHSMPNELSGGQQQRVAIARALVNDPVLIMADEPTGNLDSRTSYEIMEIFQKLNDKGITVVMVTHEPDIAQFAKSNIVFKDGKIIANDPVRERKNATEELKSIAALAEEKATT